MSSQLQVSGEAKIRDIQGPVVANSGVITALDGAASQYVRGDGTLADFPTSSGGGSSVSYYLNSSVSQGTIGGVAYRELSKEPIIGAGTDINISANGYVANYLTDANDPDLLSVPGGNFNCEFYFSVNSNNHNPSFYAELYKYDGTTFTLLGSSVGVPEFITQGTTIAPYYFAIPVPTSALALTDRLAIRIYVNVDGRTVTLHTENGHLCQVVTTFSKGMVSLNNLTDQSQNLTTGTSGSNFAIVSSGDTHTFNLPVASATNTGKLSSTDWSVFNNKQAALSFTAPLDNTSNTVSIPAATSLVDGYLDNLDWVKFNTAYNDSIISAAVTGTTTKTLTLNQQDGGTVTASWTDDNTDAVSSVFGRTGAVIAVSGDYNTSQVTELTNLYFTDTRARAALSFAAGSGAYNSTTGVITIPTNNNQITNGSNFITLGSLSGGTGITYNNTTGVITNSAPDQTVSLANGAGISVTGTYPSFTIASTITQYTDALARAAISLTTVGTSGSANYTQATGVINVPAYTLAGLGGQPLATNLTSLAGLTYASTSFVKMTAAGTFALDTNTYALASALGNYLPLAGGALTGPLTSSSNAVFKYVGGYALKLDSASATEENDLRFAKNGLDYGAIQTNTTTGDFEFYVDTTQAGGWVKMINILKNGTGTTFTGNISAGNLSGTNTGDQDLSGYLTIASASSTYLPLTGGVLTGDLKLTKASIPNIVVNATSTSSYSYFGNQEDGVLKTYFLYLNSLWSDTERRENLEIRNQVGPITFWVAATKALTIDTSKNSTFLGTITATNLSGTNTGDQTLAGLGGVPTSRTLTINGTGYDLSADRSWTITAGVSGSGTQNKLTKWNNAGGTTIGDSIISADADTATVTSTVVGPMFVLDNNVASGYSQMQFKGNTLHAYIFKGNSTYASYGGANALNFYTDPLGGGFSFNPRGSENAVFIDPLGNLGIGVGGTVGAKLDIAGGNARISSTQNGFGGISAINPSTGTSAYSGLLVGNNGATTGGGFLLLGGNYPTSGVYTSNGVYMFSNLVGGLTIAAEQVDSTIKIVTGTTIKATMAANGNLGLNETAPTNLLHLAGNVATPSLRLASTSTGFYWDIGRENATTGDFVFNYKTPSTSSTEWVRITTLGLFGIGVTPSGTYGKLTVAGGIRTTADSLSKLEIGRYNAGNPDSYIKLGSTSNRLIISNASDSADLFYFSNSGSLGLNRSPTTVLDVTGNTSGALTYMQNNGSTGYTGIDFYRQNGTHAGSVWCANDTAGATNNRNALTIAARYGGEKVIIVGGGYDPTITGGFEVQGSNTKLQGSNAYHQVNSTGGSYAYLWLNNTAVGTGNDRTAYFIQNTAGITSNGVAAGAAYLYFGQTQNMEFVWGGTSRIQMTSAGAITAQGGFFDTSDSRLKIIVKDYEQPKGIQNVAARMYLKNSRKELGYYAQDLQEILPSAVVEGADGFLNLSYSQVHTAKIAYLEKEVAELKELIKTLL